MNKITILLAAAVILGLTCCQSPKTNEAKQSKSEYMLLSTFWYQQAAERKALYYQAYNIAKERIKTISKVNKKKPQAVVLDIDETVLDNSPYQGWCILNDSTFSVNTWNHWVSKSKAAPLTGALDFTLFAKKHGIEVFYISNRHESQIEPTVNNLKTTGFPNAKKEFVLLKDTTSDKTYRRNRVEENYHIALLVGDNLGDFDHIFDKRANKYAHKMVEKHKKQFGVDFILLPNPMYGKWEKPYQQKEGNYTNTLKKHIKQFSY